MHSRKSIDIKLALENNNVLYHLYTLFLRYTTFCIMKKVINFKSTVYIYTEYFLDILIYYFLYPPTPQTNLLYI